jgi:hypothetical protein
MRTFRRTLVLLAVCASAPVAVAEALPRGVVARVHHRPVTVTAFDHWMGVATVSSGYTTIPRRGSHHWYGLRDQVMPFLISNRWIEGEALLRHVFVSRAAVARTFRRTRDAAFRSHRAFGRFLRRSGMTIYDLLYRIRIDTLSNRLRASVTQGIHDPQAQQHALGDFVVDFQQRWKAKTACARLYKAPDYCGTIG